MEYTPTPEEQALFPNLTTGDFFRCMAGNQCTPDQRVCDSDSICFSETSNTARSRHLHLCVQLYMYYASPFLSDLRPCVLFPCERWLGDGQWYKVLTSIRAIWEPLGIVSHSR